MNWAKVGQKRFKVSPHLPYLPGIAPLDCHLFPKLKNFLNERKFGSNKEVMQVVNEYFEGHEETHTREGIANLRNVCASALNFEVSMSKNKLHYKTQIVVFNIKPSY